MRFYTLLILLFSSVAVNAQSVADWWFFGDKAGIHFSGGVPAGVTNSAMKTLQGCASYSDPLGNLLFYSRGDTVWDATDNVMMNGTGLMGSGLGFGASMSAVVVPRPNSSTDYYLFTLTSGFLNTMSYSKIDMSLNGGLGAVVNAEKNIQLVDTVSYLMSVVRQPNNEDYWLITLRRGSDEAYAYEITSAGVNTTPVISQTGLPLNMFDLNGYLRCSQQNDRLAMTLWKGDTGQINAHNVHIFDVDNQTGVVTHDFGITPSVADTFNYGVEFSPSGQFLYVQSQNVSDLRQYDLNAGSVAAIDASEVLVGVGYTGTGGGALQLGPDGVVYVCRNGASFLASVLFPDDAGALCGYNHDGVGLSGAQPVLGLPQFPPFLLEGDSIVMDDHCFGDSVHFTSNYSVTTDSLFWNFGDTGTNDTSSLVNPAFLYSSSGTYTVTLIAKEGFLSDTTIFTVTILPRANADLGADTAICMAGPLVFNLDQPLATYLWSDGSTDSAFTVFTDTTISVTVFGACDTMSDTVTVDYSEAFDFNLIDSLNLCEGNTAELDPGINIEDVNYLWSTPSGPSTNDSIFASQSGTYIVMATNACDTVIDTVEVRVDPLPVAALPADTTLCFEDVVTLTRPVNDSITYTWSDSSTALNFQIDTTASIWLAAENDCGFSVDTFNIIVYTGFDISLGVDTQQCPDDSILLSASYPGAEYVWSTGATSDTIWTNQVDESYSVTVTLDSCVNIDRINVQITELACESIDCDVYFNNVFTPNGDGRNDVFRLTSDCNIQQYDLRIYSRWGQLVHYSSHDLHGWDGFIEGKPAPEGVYYYVLEFRDEVIVDVDRQSFQGSFTLLR